MQAVYNLSLNSPSFDFLVFIQSALNAGCNEVCFVSGYNRQPLYGGEAGERQRVKTIVIPACELYGLKWSFDLPSGECWGGQRAHEMSSLCSLTKPFPLMPTQQALNKVNDKFKGGRPFVVFMRECPYQEGRNSSKDWRHWAAEHDAVVVEDYFREPMSLDERVAHSELARASLGVSAGHMVIPALSTHRPYLIFKVINESYKATKRSYLESKGWKPGSQYLWATEKQKMLWEAQDDYDSIEREVSKFL